MEYKESVRRPTIEKLLLIEYLAEKAQYTLKSNWQQGIWAEPTTDDKIGLIAIAMNNGKPMKYKRRGI